MKKTIRYMYKGKRYQIVITDKKILAIKEWFKYWGVDFPDADIMKLLVVNEPGLWELMLKVWDIEPTIVEEDAQKSW